MDNVEQILNSMKNIAIIGLSPDHTKASNLVARYLQEKAYKIFPVYPKEEIILGEKVYKKLSLIEDEIDTVIMFRKASFATELLEEVIKKKIKNLWLQLGIVNMEVAKKCKEYNINFVQDRCVKIELQNKEIK